MIDYCILIEILDIVANSFGNSNPVLVEHEQSVLYDNMSMQVVAACLFGIERIGRTKTIERPLIDRLAFERSRAKSIPEINRKLNPGFQFLVAEAMYGLQAQHPQYQIDWSRKSGILRRRIKRCKKILELDQFRKDDLIEHTGPAIR